MVEQTPTLAASGSSKSTTREEKLVQEVDVPLEPTAVPKKKQRKSKAAKKQQKEQASEVETMAGAPPVS